MLLFNSVFAYYLFFGLVLRTTAGFQMSSHLRKLIGSNCVLIERGDVPPYYDCIGCVIEKAAACVDDMRHNRSYNVAMECRLNSVKEFYDHSCCPQITSSEGRRADLRYVSSAYPEALRCIINEGCGDSIIYAQLLKECRSTCPMLDPRNGDSVCFSNFNEASFTSYSMMTTIACVLAVSIYFLELI
jgi:hypothetical protein